MHSELSNNQTLEYCILPSNNKINGCHYELKYVGQQIKNSFQAKSKINANTVIY